MNKALIILSFLLMGSSLKDLRYAMYDPVTYIGHFKCLDHTDEKQFHRNSYLMVLERLESKCVRAEVLTYYVQMCPDGESSNYVVTYKCRTKEQ